MKTHGIIIKTVFSMVLICSILFFCLFGGYSSTALALEGGVDLPNNTNQASSSALINYSQYLQEHKNEKIENTANSIVDINVFDIKASEKIEQKKDQDNNDVIFTSDTGYAEWAFIVPFAGLYYVDVTYMCDQNSTTDIERSIQINGETPFVEAQDVLFRRIWTNNKDDIDGKGDQFAFQTDSRGNDIVPRQASVKNWSSQFIIDQAFSYDGPLAFYFRQGENTLRLSGIRGNMSILKIKLTCLEEIPEYSEYKTKHQQKDYNGDPIYIQGEKANYKSAPVIYPLTDRSQSATVPNDPTKLKLNTIGGSNWSAPGQWIEWMVYTEQAGMYAIGIKYRQNLISGMVSTRRLYINGQIPFTQAEYLEFPYDAAWNMQVLKYQNEVCKFYLKKGENYIRMEVSIGKSGNINKRAQQSLLELNRAYRQVIMLTGASPDPLRNYHIDTMLPHVMETFKKEHKVLMEISEQLKLESGKKGTANTVLDNLVYQLKSFMGKPLSIPSRLYNYQQNLSGLGVWILEISKQPLEIDYLVLISPDDKGIQQISKWKNSFLTDSWFRIKAFVGSFFEDYSSIGNTYSQGKTIDVWVNTGRDHASVMKRLTENVFTQNFNIGVNIKITGVGGGVSNLLLATISGIGPDVAMTMGNAEPVNYAMRGAAVPVSRFEDFDEVIKRFMPNALKPYQYQNEYYALPESQQFPMLFYRKDILNEFGLNPPKTWEELYHCISQLQKSNMTVGIPQDISFLATLIYQAGGKVYSEDKKKCVLDDFVALDRFKTWTELYTSYNLPIDYDANNRFRTGEMPIIITGYGFCSVISVFAPELKGMWDFTEIPATMREDGSYDNTAFSGGSCIMIINSSKKQKQSWEFLKWWTSTETQLNYGRDIESLLGIAARVTPATVDAMKGLSWKQEELSKLLKQWEKVECLPEVPGGYYTSRYVDNALRNVLTYRSDPREVLCEYTVTINEEILFKRNEFGLN